MTLEKLAKYISFIQGPYILLPILIILSLFKTGLTQSRQFVLMPLFLFLIVIFPTIVLYLMIKRKVISDWDVRKREERYKILPVFLGSMIFATASSYYLATLLFFHISVISLTVVFVAVAITYFWKISLHAILNTSFFLIVNFLFYWKLPYLYFLIPVVGWARYYHKHHSLLQISAGIALSVLIVLSGLHLLGYI